MAANGAIMLVKICVSEMLADVSATFRWSKP